MPSWRVLAVCVPLLTSVGLAAQSPAEPSPEGCPREAAKVAAVKYVDSVGTRYLFRGSRPLTGDASKPIHFDYKGLRKALSEAALQAGVTLPPSYKVVDVSLLWVDELSKVDGQPQTQQAMLERKMVFKEYSFFKSHPKLGQLHMWPSEGTELPPTDTSLSQCRDYLATNLDGWLRDPLVERVETIRSWLEDPSQIGISGPMVVYVHCYSGCDRTGELIGSYGMRYQGLSWEEMTEANAEVCNRPSPLFFTENCNALRWYALYVNLAFGKSLQWDSASPCPSAMP